MSSRTMSWADRARSSQAPAGQKAGAPSNSASTALSNGSPKAPSIPSSASSRSNPSLNEHENEEETPASSLAPSAASVDEIHDPKSALKPAPIPQVNVWSLRKQTLQPQNTSKAPTIKDFTSETESFNPRDATASQEADSAQMSKSQDVSTGSLSTASESSATGRAPPVQVNGDHTSTIPASSLTTAPKPATDPWKPVQKSTIPPIASDDASDTSAWPSPDAASLAAEEKKKSAVQAQKTVEESDAPRTEKKKAKWIPIQADITVKSSHVPKQGHIEAMQRRQERNKDQNAQHRQSRSASTSTSTGDQRRRRENTNSTVAASRPPSQASNPSDQRSHSVVSSRRPSLALASAPRFEALQDPQQGTSTSSKNNQRASPMTPPFVYEPSSAVHRQESLHASANESSSPVHGQPTVEGTYQPESMHGPLLPGSYRRGGRPNYHHGGGGATAKGSRGLGMSRNGYSTGRGGYHGEQARSRPDSPGSRSGGSRHHHTPLPAEAYPSYPTYDYYGHGQSWYPAMNGYYPSIPAAASYVPFQPVIAPYVDGGTGLPFERPHPNNLHMLVDPPLEPTAYWVLGQIEFYLSEDNLARDTFLREQMDNEGWVDISMLASFKRIQSLTSDLDLIADALARSTVLEAKNNQVRRRNDWFKWVMPNARPSAASPGTSTGGAGISPRRASMQSETGHLPKEEINVEAHPVPEGLTPHSQHPLIIGGTEVPPKRWRSPASKRVEVPEVEEVQQR